MCWALETTIGSASRCLAPWAERWFTKLAAEIETDEIELAGEHFLALVEALPHRLAEFGVFRTGDQAERHLQYAIKLFLRAIQPVAQKSGARRAPSAVQ